MKSSWQVRAILYFFGWLLVWPILIISLFCGANLIIEPTSANCVSPIQNPDGTLVYIDCSEVSPAIIWLINLFKSLPVLFISAAIFLFIIFQIVKKWPLDSKQILIFTGSLALAITLLLVNLLLNSSLSFPRL